MKPDKRRVPLLGVLICLIISGCGTTAGEGWQTSVPPQRTQDPSEALIITTENILKDPKNSQSAELLINRGDSWLTALQGQLTDPEEGLSPDMLEKNCEILSDLKRIHENLEKIGMPVRHRGTRWSVEIRDYSVQLEQMRRKTAEECFQQGENELSAGNESEAFRWFEKAAGKYQITGSAEQKIIRKSVAKACLEAGQVLEGGGSPVELSEAGLLYKQALLYNPQLHDARSSLQRVQEREAALFCDMGEQTAYHQDRGSLTEALEYYRKALESLEEYPRALRLIGMTKTSLAASWYAEGRMEQKRSMEIPSLAKAVEAYREACRWDPGYEDAFLRLRKLSALKELYQLEERGIDLKWKVDRMEVQLAEDQSGKPEIAVLLNRITEIRMTMDYLDRITGNLPSYLEHSEEPVVLSGIEEHLHRMNGQISLVLDSFPDSAAARKDYHSLPGELAVLSRELKSEINGVLISTDCFFQI